VLIIENVDRLSRLPPDEATALIMSIVKAGVDVVTTSPEQLYTAATIRQVGVWIPLQVACCLAAEESRKKGERVADAWDAKRKTAAVSIVSKKGPAWLRLTADRKEWAVIEQKAKWVRRMFALASEGYGVGRIAGVLGREHPEGLMGNGWQPGYIQGILRSRSCIGEFQPFTGVCARKGRPSTRKPAGEAVKNYFPAVVSEADFYRVQQALDGRRRGGGRIVGVPNLFNGILFDALDKRKMVVNQQHRRKVLVSGGAIRRMPGSVYHSIQYDVFERGILSRLAELTAADVLGKPSAAEDRVAELTGRLTTCNRNRNAVRTKAAGAEDVSSFFDLLADLDRQRKDLVAELEKARAEAASMEGDNIGEFTSLVAMLDDAEPSEREGLRRKVRAALRRVVKEMWALVVPRGRVRLCAVQVRLSGGAHRDYLIYHKGTQSWVRSLASAAPGPLDLRDPEEAAVIAAALETMPLDAH